MRRLLLLTLVLGVARSAHAEPEPAPLLLLSPDLPAATADPLRRDAAARGLELASPAPRVEPASETVLGQVRPLYQGMAFARAVKLLIAAEQSLVAGGPITAGGLQALAELEDWLGACLFLTHDRAGALEHWALARRLAPGTRLDPIFPPNVRKAFAARVAAARPVAVTVRLAPVGARLWIDGRLVSGALTAAPGLHHVVVERADYAPSVQVQRITRAAAQVTVDLREPAAPGEALRQLAAGLATAPLGRDEALGVSALLKRPLWIVRAGDGSLTAQRFAAADAAHAVGQVEAADAPALLVAMLGPDRSAVALAPAVVTPAPAPTAAPELVRDAPPPRKPTWKRAWFWSVLGASVLVAAGVVVGTTVGLAAPRDYDVRVR